MTRNEVIESVLTNARLDVELNAPQSAVFDAVERQFRALPFGTFADEAGNDTTFATAFHDENELHRRRFVHATRPREPMNLEQVAELSRRMEGET